MAHVWWFDIGNKKKRMNENKTYIRKENNCLYLKIQFMIIYYLGVKKSITFQIAIFLFYYNISYAQISLSFSKIFKMSIVGAVSTWRHTTDECGVLASEAL